MNQNQQSTTTNLSIPHFDANISAPPNNITKLNRFNLPGQSVLYLTSSPMTAIEEVIVSIGEFVSVASFKIIKKAKLLDISFNQSLYHYMNYEGLCFIALSPYVDDKQYIRTNFIKDFFVWFSSQNNRIIDGLTWDSTLSKGRCICLFHINNAVYIQKSSMIIEKTKKEYLVRTKMDKSFPSTTSDFKPNIEQTAIYEKFKNE